MALSVQAMLEFPSAICSGGADVVYVAVCHQIFSFSVKDKTLTCFSGSADPGLQNGARQTALFNQIQGLAISPTGDLLVSDSGNNCLRIIDTQGNVDKFTGSYKSGYRNGNRMVAQFNCPRGLCVTRSGHLIVADYNNHVLRKVNLKSGEVSLRAGTLGKRTILNHPSQVAITALAEFVVVAEARREDGCELLGIEDAEIEMIMQWNGCKALWSDEIVALYVQGPNTVVGTRAVDSNSGIAYISLKKYQNVQVRDPYERDMVNQSQIRAETNFKSSPDGLFSLADILACIEFVLPLLSQSRGGSRSSLAPVEVRAASVVAPIAAAPVRSASSPPESSAPREVARPPINPFDVRPPGAKGARCMTTLRRNTGKPLPRKGATGLPQPPNRRKAASSSSEEEQFSSSSEEEAPPEQLPTQQDRRNNRQLPETPPRKTRATATKATAATQPPPAAPSSPPTTRSAARRSSARQLLPMTPQTPAKASAARPKRVAAASASAAAPLSPLSPTI